MLNSLISFVKEKKISLYNISGLSICSVINQQKGFDLITELLYLIVNNKSVLYLSGGETPRDLYRRIAVQNKLNPGALGLIDERYGPRLHAGSNELMIRDTGLLNAVNVPFFPMLNADCSLEESASDYDKKLRFLHSTYQKHIGILGIGADGHTAGIAGNRKDFHNPIFNKDKEQNLCESFYDEKGYFKERVTMTFLGLSMLDIILVLIFGEKKKKALELVFTEGSEETIPARFYKRKSIADKTLFITDQKLFSE